MSKGRKYNQTNHRASDGNEGGLSKLGPCQVLPCEWFGLKLWTVVNTDTGEVISDRLYRKDAQALADRINLSPCVRGVR